VALLAVAPASALAGCGGAGADEGASRDPAAAPASTADRATTATTEPPATRIDAVTPIVEDLLARNADVSARMLGNPLQALDPEAPVLDDLAEIYTDDVYEQLVGVFRQNAADQLVFEPYDTEPMLRTTLVGDLAAVDDDRVVGEICHLYNLRSTSPAAGGGLLDGVTHPGQVTAVRVDGRWRLELVGSREDQLCDPEAGA
jgi:hypothetical protein